MRGRDEAILTTARNMLAEGISEKTIAKVTGLDADVIKKLVKKDVGY